MCATLNTSHTHTHTFGTINAIYTFAPMITCACYAAARACFLCRSGPANGGMEYHKWTSKLLRCTDGMPSLQGECALITIPAPERRCPVQAPLGGWHAARDQRSKLFRRPGTLSEQADQGYEPSAVSFPAIERKASRHWFIK